MSAVLGGRLATPTNTCHTYSDFHIPPKHVDVLTGDSLTIFSFRLWLSGAPTRCSFTWIGGVAMVITDESRGVGELILF